jgi:hypothetical protein
MSVVGKKAANSKAANSKAANSKAATVVPPALVHSLLTHGNSNWETLGSLKKVNKQLSTEIQARDFFSSRRVKQLTESLLDNYGGTLSLRYDVERDNDKAPHDDPDNQEDYEPVCSQKIVHTRTDAALELIRSACSCIVSSMRAGDRSLYFMITIHYSRRGKSYRASSDMLMSSFMDGSSPWHACRISHEYNQPDEQTWYIASTPVPPVIKRFMYWLLYTIQDQVRDPQTRHVR